MEQFDRKKAEGAICRARINWQVHGEKPSRYFCNLENYNSLQKYIPQLLVKNSSGKVETVSDQQDVEKQQMLKVTYGAGVHSLKLNQTQ